MENKKEVNIPEGKDVVLHNVLKKVFGFDKFKDNQEHIIRNLMQGMDTFVIMPTGGGKSLCYQLPALISPGVAIIVSPLIALMKNQVDSIRNFGTETGIAHVLNSSLSRGEIAQVKEDLLSGKTKLLYLAPESLNKEDNILFLRDIEISFYAVDEAHCISEWGHDFRPEYRRIRPIIETIGKNVPIIALTATATPKVQQDIIKTLQMQNARSFLSSFNRPNLYYEVRPKTTDVFKDILRFVRLNIGKSGIIYCLSRKKVEEIAQALQVNGVKAVPYHAGLDAKTRKLHQDMFLMEEIDVIVATIAFGMGIDKPDVRFIIHHDMPKSLEGYYQETGRSGRDGGEGQCLGFFSLDDINKIEKFGKNKPVAEQEIALQLLQEVIAYAESSVCRRKQLLHYFGESYQAENCSTCDNCLHPKMKFEAKEHVLTVLGAVKETNQQFKAKQLISILTGNVSGTLKSQKVLKYECFEAGSDYNDKFWNAVIRQMLIMKLLQKDIENYGVIKITPDGENFLKNPLEVQMTKDHDYDTDDEDDEFIAAGGLQKGSGGDKMLFSMLKDLTKVEARKRGCAPYLIFQDPSLEDMAIQYPITLDELKNISGVGVGKAQKFGQPFVELIKKHVDENEITRPNDVVVKSVINKSGMKVYIIQAIDRKIPLEQIALAKNLTLDELLDEIERIVTSGTKVNLNYYINEYIDEYHQQDIYDYFLNAESDSIEYALQTLGENEFTEQEVRLIRIKVMSDIGN
jgi:ATP-dependent DNA helicase RecQ